MELGIWHSFLNMAINTQLEDRSTTQFESWKESHWIMPESHYSRLLHWLLTTLEDSSVSHTSLCVRSDPYLWAEWYYFVPEPPPQVLGGEIIAVRRVELHAHRHTQAVQITSIKNAWGWTESAPGVIKYNTMAVPPPACWQARANGFEGTLALRHAHRYHFNHLDWTELTPTPGAQGPITLSHTPVTLLRRAPIGYCWTLAGTSRQ